MILNSALEVVKMAIVADEIVASFFGTVMNDSRFFYRKLAENRNQFFHTILKGTIDEFPPVIVLLVCLRQHFVLRKHSIILRKKIGFDHVNNGASKQFNFLVEKSILNCFPFNRDFITDFDDSLWLSDSEFDKPSSRYRYSSHVDTPFNSSRISVQTP